VDYGRSENRHQIDVGHRGIHEERYCVKLAWLRLHPEMRRKNTRLDGNGRVITNSYDGTKEEDEVTLNRMNY
jgi:hypothetical protein